MTRKREGWFSRLHLGHLAERLSLISRRIAEHRKRKWQEFYDSIRTKNAVAHVNDCADNARARLEGQADSLIGRNAGFYEISSDLQAGAEIITALDALTGAEASHKHRDHDKVVLANIAPRDGEGKRHPNGVPFCYFWDKRTGALVVTTAGEMTLAMIKKFDLADEYFLLDTHDTLGVLRASGMIDEAERLDSAAQLTHQSSESIEDTQFRSLYFMQRVAAYLLRYGKVPKAKPKSMREVPDAPLAVYHVDQFAKYGNCKTTVTPGDVFSPEIVEILRYDKKRKYKGVPITTLTINPGGKPRELPVYRRLSDVPEGVLAIVLGSSGRGEGQGRFLEIVLQGGHAGKELGLKTGDSIF